VGTEGARSIVAPLAPSAHPGASARPRIPEPFRWRTTNRNPLVADRELNLRREREGGQGHETHRAVEGVGQTGRLPPDVERMSCSWRCYPPLAFSMSIEEG